MMHLVNIKTLSHCTEALTTAYRYKDAALQSAEVHVCELKVWLEASDAHATICNLKNQALCCQASEKTGTCKKHKINMEGHVITPLNGVIC